jgi:hypothetical protein
MKGTPAMPQQLGLEDLGRHGHPDDSKACLEQWRITQRMGGLMMFHDHDYYFIMHYY